jgi:ParB-like chromosome segregation protein Spo0J
MEEHEQMEGQPSGTEKDPSWPTIPLSEIRIHEELRELAPRLSDAEFCLLRECIKRDRMVTFPVLIDRNTGFLIDGHHRVRAARELGFTHIPCVYRDAKDLDEMKELSFESSMARRNLRIWTRIELGYKRYLEPARKAANARMSEGGKGKRNCANLPRTAIEEAAQKVGVSSATFKRGVRILDAASEHPVPKRILDIIRRLQEDPELAVSKAEKDAFPEKKPKAEPSGKKAPKKQPGKPKEPANPIPKSEEEPEPDLDMSDLDNVDDDLHPEGTESEAPAPAQESTGGVSDPPVPQLRVKQAAPAPVPPTKEPCGVPGAIGQDKPMPTKVDPGISEADFLGILKRRIEAPLMLMSDAIGLRVITKLKTNPQPEAVLKQVGSLRDVVQSTLNELDAILAVTAKSST